MDKLDSRTKSGVSFPLDWLDKETNAESSNIYNTITILKKNSIAFGIWNATKTKTGIKIQLYRKGVLDVLHTFGFYRLEEASEPTFIKEANGFIEHIDISKIGLFVYHLISRSGDLDISGNFNNETPIKVDLLLETWLRQFESTMKTTVLNHLDAFPNAILRDTKDEKFITFNNGVLEIKNAGIHLHAYDSFKSRYGVWKERIIPYQINLNVETTKSQFEDFIWNVSGKEHERFNAIKSAIGYLCHNFQTKSQNQAVIFVDEVCTSLDKPEGGTGKGLCIQAIAKISNVLKIDGKGFLPDNRFAFQDVATFTQVVVIDDIKKHFPIDRLNSLLTEGLTVEKKGKQSYTFPKEQSPKVALTSNMIPDTAGHTRQRRQFIVEFGDYLTQVPSEWKSDPIKHYYNVSNFFADDWDQQEWNSFYLFMIDCCQYYLTNGLTAYEHKNVVANSILQRTCKEFTEWIAENPLLEGEKYSAKDKYREFINYSGIDDSDIKQRKFSSWVRFYAEQHGLVYENKSSNGATQFSLTSNKH